MPVRSNLRIRKVAARAAVATRVRALATRTPAVPTRVRALATRTTSIGAWVTASAVPAAAVAAFCMFALGACSVADRPLYRLLSPDESGVDFVNHVEDDPELNIINYLYFYDGGGVAVGDISGDGLPDIYFTANEGPNRLYLNKGGLRFEDVTDEAGVAGSSDWNTGVTMADVDGDGLLDIYVSAVDGVLGLSGKNELFVNNGDGTFSERAADFGLDFRGYATQAAFFDFDLDGDLDVFLLNHSTHEEETYGRETLRHERHPQAGDRLYRNDGGSFKDVSNTAGIYGGPVGYGLGVSVSDLNMDGWPDVYVANDFHENDYLYLNRGDGTFSERIEEATGHNSRSSMGSDAADFNNDGLPDVVVLDMLPADEHILKTSASVEGRYLSGMKVQYGYHHQYTRNTLHLNRGVAPFSGQVDSDDARLSDEGDSVAAHISDEADSDAAPLSDELVHGDARFSDVGYLAGIEATDWSWSALLFDADNDGFKDLLVTNGIWRRPNDLDYIEAVSTPAMQESLEDISEDDLNILEEMPHVPVANFLFGNNGDLTFSDRAKDWGLEQTFFSNGAAYADLDNDGDLDLVLNNLNEPAAIYENRGARARRLGITLEGEGQNTAGIGSKVIVQADGMTQLQELIPTRGFQSSVDPRLHFGLGAAETIDTVLVVWPDRRYQRLFDVPADTHLVLRQQDAEGTFDYARFRKSEAVFAPRNVDVDYLHVENEYVDMTREPLIPHKSSMDGPALAVADVNGDGLDDLFAGGAKWQPGSLLLQLAGGGFERRGTALWQADSLYEDVDAGFFDADGDGDLDLYVVSAGNEWWGDADALRDRLYVNDGDGGFARGALPDFFENGSVVRSADYDGDGDTDLFVGGRVVAKAYGTSPRSYLLRNDGGRFVDETPDELRNAGMITDAAWADFDGDGHLDLAVVGEWMAPRIYFARNSGFHAIDIARPGWWSAVAASDLDGDGLVDLVLGNLGLNSRLRASVEQPVRLYMGDFDANGEPDRILTSYRNGVNYPLAGRDELLTAFPSFARKYPTYESYGARRIEEILSNEVLDKAEVLRAEEFASMIALNRGAGTTGDGRGVGDGHGNGRSDAGTTGDGGGRGVHGGFDVRPLPVQAQFSPVSAILVDDFDADGYVDIVLGGNFSGVMPVRGRYDASYGCFLRGNGDGTFVSLEPHQSGLWLEGEIRDLKRLRAADGTNLIVAARNDDSLQFVAPRGRGDVLTERR